MLSSLQSTHEHADSKAGILVAAQGVLVGTAGTWNGQAVRAWEHGGPAGAVAGALLAAFALGLWGGAACLALALRPRLLRPAGPNRYSFVELARVTARPVSSNPAGNPVTARALDAAERLELSETIVFLARVAMVKYRYLSVAVVCTSVMGVSAGMFLVLRPTLH